MSENFIAKNYSLMYGLKMLNAISERIIHDDYYDIYDDKHSMEQKLNSINQINLIIINTIINDMTKYEED